MRSLASAHLPAVGAFASVGVFAAIRTLADAVVVGTPIIGAGILAIVAVRGVAMVLLAAVVAVVVARALVRIVGVVSVRAVGPPIVVTLARFVVDLLARLVAGVFVVGRALGCLVLRALVGGPLIIGA